MSITIQNPRAFARAMSAQHSQEWLSWTPSATEAVLIKNFGYDPTPTEIDKIESLKEVLRSDRVFSDALVFEKAVLAFNDEPVDFEVWQAASPKEIALGLKMIRAFAGEQDFGREVRAYVAASLLENDIHVASEPLGLAFCAPELRSISKASLSLRERAANVFADIYDGPKDRLEGRLQSRMRTMDRQADLGAQDGRSREDARFIKQQVAYLTEIALYLRKHAS